MNQSISHQITSRARSVLILMVCLQFLVLSASMMYVAYNDATRRGNFLTQSNVHSLGLMMSTGDIFQLRSTISSFRNEDTPEIWLLNEDGRSALSASIQEENIGDSLLPIKFKGGNALIKTEFPITYNGIKYGRLILMNRINIAEWFAVGGVILGLTLIFFFIQGKILEAFALRLASSISNVGILFHHSSSLSDLDNYQMSRIPSLFSEVEVMATKVYSVLRNMINAAQIEKEAERFKAIAMVTAHVAHDLRHPVSVFEATHRVRDWKSFEQLKPELERALNRVENMIDGLRNSDSERLVKLSKDSLQLGEIVSGVLPLAREKGVLIRCEGETSELEFSMDKPKLLRAIHNLLFNSLEAGCTEIILHCRRNESEYTLEVRDNGPGVPNDGVPMLFREGATFGKAGGTGLGLSGVKKIITAHSGIISYSRQQNTTVFSMTLPFLKIMSENSSDVVTGAGESADTDLVSDSKLRILIDVQDPYAKKKILESLHVQKIELIEDRESIAPGDLIYTDSDETIARALERRASLLHHGNYENNDDAIAAVNARIRLVNSLTKDRR